MDVFSRTFLPVAVVWAGVAIPTVSRHLPVLRRCVEAGDSPVLLTRCSRPEGLARGDYLLLLTHRRLVVIRQTSLLHRVRLHLNMELRHLGDVTWHTDARRTAVELAATVIDGVRERFLIRAAGPGQVWRLDLLLERVFRPAVLVERANPRPPAPADRDNAHQPAPAVHSRPVKPHRCVPAADRAPAADRYTPSADRRRIPAVATG